MSSIFFHDFRFGNSIVRLLYQGLYAVILHCYRKIMILDTGIYQRFLRLDLTNLLLDEKIEQINKGALAEMFVGIELVKSQNNRLPAELYYWQREKEGSAAEVDYVIQQCYLSI